MILRLPSAYRKATLEAAETQSSWVRNAVLELTEIQGCRIPGGYGADS